MGLNNHQIQFKCPDGSRRNPSYLSGRLTHGIIPSEGGYLIVPANPIAWVYEEERSGFEIYDTGMQDKKIS